MAMWNPWRGCKKCSEGCLRCYIHKGDVAPAIINTFLESADFSGKKIILFATSGGSKFGKTVEELKVSVSADTQIIEGKLLNGRQSMESIKAWTDTLDLS